MFGFTYIISMKSKGMTEQTKNFIMKTDRVVKLVESGTCFWKKGEIILKSHVGFRTFRHLSRRRSIQEINHPTNTIANLFFPPPLSLQISKRPLSFPSTVWMRSCFGFSVSDSHRGSTRRLFILYLTTTDGLSYPNGLSVRKSVQKTFKHVYDDVTLRPIRTNLLGWTWPH